MLFFSGTRSVKLDDKASALLRAYVLRGGMLDFDSVAGSPYFKDSVRALMLKAFPEVAWRQLPLDHPLVHMVNDVKAVRYSDTVSSTQPQLEGLYIGSRVGVLLSPYGLGCGWDNHPVPFLKNDSYYDVASAMSIGLNLVSYTIGYHRVGLS